MCDDLDPWKQDEEDAYERSRRQHDWRQHLLSVLQEDGRPRQKQRQEGWDKAVNAMLRGMDTLP
jgi:hypothetical protein